MIKLPFNREISDSAPIFVIAEIGSNWSTLDDCVLSIQAAKNCGADAVKFQLYTCHALYGKNSYDDPSELKIEWLPKLKSTCDKLGIEFMCSAFSPELMDRVNQFVNIHKIASAEMTHVRILQKARDYGKPIILSTGASGVADIGAALEIIKTNPTVLMYCVAAYPAKHTLLSNIGLMKETFGLPVGLSDHSLDVYMTPMGSVLAGACVIEKHVNFRGVESPDSPHSLNETEFRLMVKSLRGDVKPNIGPNPEEQEMVLRHNRRLIATKDIKVGETFEENKNFGIYRSLRDDTHALSPFAINHVLGKTAKQNIQAGCGIGPGDF